jgi:hypothetical protein
MDTTSAKASSYPRQLQFALKTRGALKAANRAIRAGVSECSHLICQVGREMQ